ncbi:hypothetical protein Scep_016349 [Stephania cephalantha]|uniref:Uncharacterized protein n=1 Tax=Stephania cephalantha TaxID=152367 RepID=A0AAP0NVQ1_9MAGN
MSEHQRTKDGEQSEGNLLSSFNVSDHHHIVSEAELFVHPRHMKQMKPHQIEGFKFLQKNLLSDEPGGCIMAHAPGFGKTFMIISFIQSFLAKYLNGRPLIILPKGIVSAWKDEFQRWQVQEIPCYDFYSLKANNRSQQLDVLKQRIDQKGILFLGYQQFSKIISDYVNDKIAAACHDILLTVPTLLILDEGHTSRNKESNVLCSLAKIQTPRKVVLSGESSPEHREWSTERFNTSADAKVFFGAIKACGEGISLVGASRLLILDVHMNPSVTRQAIGRAFRPGQTRKVHVYRLVGCDSPEEQHHNVSFGKELTSKIWFEWSECSGNEDFKMKTVNVKDSEVAFWQRSSLRKDVKILYQRTLFLYK